VRAFDRALRSAPVNTPPLAVALLAGGLLAAVTGLLVSVLTAGRRYTGGDGPPGWTDLGFVGMVIGLVVAILGSGDWVFLLLTV